MLSNSLRAIVLLGLVLLVLGCGLHPRISPAPGHVQEQFADGIFLDVPFVPQNQENDCGPAALASLLTHRNHALPLATITAEVFTPALGRTLLPDMENYARSLGLSPVTGRGDLDFLEQRINAGDPVVLLLDMGRMTTSQGHYVVLVGHAPEGFLMHSGHEAYRFMAADTLKQRWSRMNNLYLYLE
ncbi:cysteine peptidase family C39 domain-containing protein [Desulfonatronum sp. SC1]|uniref:cysteine peptidase family C39 domain-containing protein n=1 Tax=Desulfonatronum sp. SC1 TaxID=2109626 RepID=UPI001304EDF4|nr:cysteine peptidase family C39 domain-containing protein [Desulfonatronum sp. SC1]